MKRVSVDVDGREMQGAISLSGSLLWVHLGGETFTVDVGTSLGRRRTKSANVRNAGEVTAPMPGKIVKVFVNVDQMVEQGQVLLVMEAMKMEYTLKAIASGKVKSISASAGDQVNLGQILILLETT